MIIYQPNMLCAKRTNDIVYFITLQLIVKYNFFPLSKKLLEIYISKDILILYVRPIYSVIQI